MDNWPESTTEEQGVDLCDYMCGSEDVGASDDLIDLIDSIEEDLRTATMLDTFQLGIALAVIGDRLWNINAGLAQKCSNLQHRILENK